MAALQFPWAKYLTSLTYYLPFVASTLDSRDAADSVNLAISTLEMRGECATGITWEYILMFPVANVVQERNEQTANGNT